MKPRSLPLLVFLFVSIVLAPPAFAQDGDEPIVASDMLRIKQLGDVNVSPDGRSVLYSVREIVEDDEREGRYRYETQLWIVEDGGRAQPRRLTSSRQGASQAAWHPDGDRLAFVRTVDGSPQVFSLSLLGGEAEQLTSFEHGASSPRWSPDGMKLLFGASLQESTVRELYGEPTWRTEQPGRRPSPGEVDASPDGSIDEIRAWLDQQAAEGEPRVITRLDFQGEQDLNPELSLRHHYVIELQDDGSWSDPRPITSGWVSFSNAEWHPDGERILFAGWSEPTVHPDRERRNDIFITYVDQPRPRRLFSVEHHTVASPAIAPDGQTIAFVARDNRDPGYAQNQLGVFPLDAPNQYRILTENFDRSVGAPRWSQDNWYLYFTAAADGGFPLYRVRVFDEPPAPPTEEEDENADEDDEAEEIIEDVSIERLTATDTGIRSFDASTATLFYVKTRVENPFELYVSRAPFTESTRVTEHNASWLANKRISRPTHGTVQRDTLTIDYWMMPPTFAEPGQRYPLMVQIHGGPAAMWGPGEASMWHEFQFYAARGYTVVYSNPRGSGGYGYDFQRANFQDWGHGPAGDVLAVADASLDYPFVDAERQVVTGGSYAGYLTAWIITQDHRFRAAAAQRGVYDLPTFLGEGNAWRLVPSHFGGYPWEADPEFEASPDDPWRPSPALAAQLAAAADDYDEEDAEGTAEREIDEEAIADALADPSFREILIANSPLTFVDQIQTPLLIKHGDQDLRTGVIQSEMLYRAMKLMDKDVEYARYPRAGHEMSRSGEPHHRMDRLLRIYEFMERFVR